MIFWPRFSHPICNIFKRCTSVSLVVFTSSMSNISGNWKPAGHSRDKFSDLYKVSTLSAVIALWPFRSFPWACRSEKTLSNNTFRRSFGKSIHGHYYDQVHNAIIWMLFGYQVYIYIHWRCSPSLPFIYLVTHCKFTHLIPNFLEFNIILLSIIKLTNLIRAIWK